MKAKTKLNVLMAFALAAMLLGGTTVGPQVSVAAVPSYGDQGTVNVGLAAPYLTAVDPYANPDTPNPLNPVRPYWYAADASGLSILDLNTNLPLGSVTWPATFDLAMPDGTFLEDVPAPVAGWEPMGLMVPYPSLEAIGPEAVEGSETLAFVEMAHSGYEWQSSDGRFRDMIVPAMSVDTESSMLLVIDVTDPASPVPVAAALLGHEAGQMAWEPSAGAVYVGGMPSTSLPASLQSFISKITPPEVGAEPPPPFAPQTLYPLCGPEIEWSGEDKSAEGKTGVPVNVPGAWICDTIHGAGEGEGPFIYEFTGLPAWLIAHVDPTTGLPDGLLYGTPTEVGIYTFVVTTTDLAAGPDDPASASAVITIDVKPSVAEYVGGEWEGGEAGVLGALAIEGTGPDGTRCALAQTESGLALPTWVESVEVPNGCVILGLPILAGEYYEFQMPNYHFLDPYGEGTVYDPVVWKGAVLGTYGFDPLPDGVGISGLAYHEIDMIPGEPDKYVLNGEFIGIDPATGQLYADTLPYEQSDTIEEIGPPATIVDSNEVSELLAADGLTPLALAGSGFGNIVVEADRDIYVAADGAVIKVSGGTPSTIPVSGAQASYLALDSDLAPAVKPDLGGPGQVDHGVLWMTNPGSGDVTVIDTEVGAVSQTLNAGAALGGVAVDSVSTGLAYVAVPSAANVALFGSGIAWQAAPKIAAINPAEAIVDPTLFTVGEPGSITVIATGWPIPSLTVSGDLPEGVTAVDNGKGTLTLSGTPTVPGVYSLTVTATNGVLPDASQAFTLTVQPLAAPAITSAPAATLVVNVAGQFKFEATGWPVPILTVSGTLPDGVTFHDNAACSPAVPVGCTGSAFLGGLPTNTGVFPLTVTATNSQGTFTQEFTLNISDSAAPAITSADATTFRLRGAGSFTVRTTGSPMANLSATGALPDGVTFTDNYNGTATLAGRPTAEGSWPLVIKANNGKDPEVQQNFTLTVEQMPAATTELVTTTALSTPSEALALNPKTNRVYAMTSMDVGPATITVLDNEGHVLAYIEVAQDAEYMAVNGTTNRLYVPQWDRSCLVTPGACTDNQELAIIDTRTNMVIDTIEMPLAPDSAAKFYPEGVAVDEVNNVVYVGATTAEAEAGEEEGGDTSELPGYILAFDGRDNTFLGFVQAGRDPEGLVFNPTAMKVYASNEDDGNLTIVPAIIRERKGSWGTPEPFSDQTPFTTDLLFPEPTCQGGDEVRPFGEADKIVVDPLTNKVYVTDDAYEVAEVSADGTAIRLLAINEENCGSPNSANNIAIAVDRGAKVDGVRQGILYVTTEADTITIVDLSTFSVVGSLTIEGGHHIDWPVITQQNRLFISDESWASVAIYNLKDGLTP